LLRERYATADIDSALGHAAAFGALDHRAVERILAARSTPRTLDEYVAEDTLVLERLRRHLEFLGLTLTLAELDERLAWATRERPGATALPERVLGLEAARKLEERIARRVHVSGLVERKALEAF